MDTYTGDSPGAEDAADEGNKSEEEWGTTTGNDLQMITFFGKVTGRPGCAL